MEPAQTETTKPAPKASEPEPLQPIRIGLVARDPKSLYVHWQVTEEQQRYLNVHAPNGHLVLRIFRDGADGELQSEIHVEPESLSWFVHVPRAGATYVAAIGYFDASGEWHLAGVSDSVVTPADTMAPEPGVRVAAVPRDVPLPELVAAVMEIVGDGVNLTEGLDVLREKGHPVAAEPMPQPPAPAADITQLVHVDTEGKVWFGSLEITQLVAGRIAQREQQELAPVSSEAPLHAAPVREQEAAPQQISSPAGGMPQAKRFWFKINTELVVYGSTETDATLVVAGRPIKLRPDGSFSLRFALPDGDFELPVTATAADESDSRTAEIKVSRRVVARGDVEEEPMPAPLSAPSATAKS